jgi:alpha-mannosidase
MDANFNMLDALGVSMHHDAITGTDKQYVANDYTTRLQKSVDISRKVYKKELSDLLES